MKDVIRQINADGVNPADIVKVQRKGYKARTGEKSERLGTVLVELSSAEVRTKIMKSKKVLENIPQLKDIRISNMKSQNEVSQAYFNRQMLKMVPGGEKFYIAGNGFLRPQSRPLGPPRAYQGPSEGPGLQFQSLPGQLRGPAPQHAPPQSPINSYRG